MWPLIVRIVTRYSPYITLPFAAVIGFIGYHIEDIISDKYTPYSGSIEEQRLDRLTSEEVLNNPTNVERLKYKENVFSKNLPPTLK